MIRYSLLSFHRFLRVPYYSLRFLKVPYAYLWFFVVWLEFTNVGVLRVLGVDLKEFVVLSGSLD